MLTWAMSSKKKKIQCLCIFVCKNKFLYSGCQWACTSKLYSWECRYIKEGSTVSVMGVVQRNENVLMIVPPTEPITTGCQWTKCILSASLDGIVLRCEDASKNDVIPV